MNNSSLYFGEVRHQRRSPKKHAFCYRVFMVHLFIDEIKEVFKKNPFWSINRLNLSTFLRKDYHNPKEEDLSKAVRKTMSEQLGYPVTGPVSVITHYVHLVIVLTQSHFITAGIRRKINPIP